MNITDYFEFTRIINLKHREDRRQETHAEFTRHGLTLDGQRVGFFEAIAPQEAEGFPSPGVRGCFLSHLKVLEEAQRRGVHALVMEDDILFARQMGTLGEQAIEQLKSTQWDMAYFGHSLGDEPGAPQWRLMTRPTMLAHFYAVNAKALPALTAYLQTVLQRPAGHPLGGPMHFDGALHSFREQNPDLKTYFFTKNLGFQRPSKTDLHEVSILDKLPWLSPLTKLLRTVKTAYVRLRH